MNKLDFFDKRNFLLTDPKIIKLDNLRIEMNRSLNRLMILQGQEKPGRFAISLTTLEKTKKLTGEVLKKSKKTSETTFDEIVRRDIERNAQIVNSYLDYEYNFETELRVGSFLERVFGKPVYQRFLRDISPTNFPHDRLDEFSEIFEERISRRIDLEEIFQTPTHPMFEKVKAEILSRIKEQGRISSEFYKNMQVATNPEELSIWFSDPSLWYSYWSPNSPFIHIDPHEVLCWLNENGNVKLEDHLLSNLTIHEQAHGINEICSNNLMPGGLSASPLIFDYLHMGSDSEGVALNLEQIWFQELEQGRVSSRIFTDGELEELKISDETYFAKKSMQIAYDLLRKKNTEEFYSERYPDSFKKESWHYNRLAKLSGIKKLREDDSQLEDRSIEDTIGQMVYPIGYESIRKIVDEAKDKGYGNSSIVNALMRGCWHDINAKRDFIFEVYLPGLER